MEILYLDDQIVVCVKPIGISSEDGENSLPDLLRQQLGGEVFVAIKDVNLSIQLTDGLYDKTLLTCDYVLSLDDEVYTVTMTYAARFSYGEVEEIAAPIF